MSIIDAVDQRDFASLAQLTQALQKDYRSQLGPLPDAEGEAEAAADA